MAKQDFLPEWDNHWKNFTSQWLHTKERLYLYSLQKSHLMGNDFFSLQLLYRLGLIPLLQGSLSPMTSHTPLQRYSDVFYANPCTAGIYSCPLVDKRMWLSWEYGQKTISSCYYDCHVTVRITFRSTQPHCTPLPKIYSSKTTPILNPLTAWN